MDQDRLRLIQFDFRHACSWAIGDSIREHSNVLQLSLVRTYLDLAVISLLNQLPPTLRRLAHSWFPTYSLPQDIILKRPRDHWKGEFNNEKHMYHKLEPLQGSLIPTYHGEAWCDGSPALILSVVDGCLPRKQGDETLSKSEFRRRLEAAYRKLAAFGVSQGDAVLDNFLLVDQGVVVIDLESVYEITPDEAERAVASHVDHLTKSYAKYLDGKGQLTRLLISRE